MNLSADLLQQSAIGIRQTANSTLQSAIGELLTAYYWLGSRGMAARNGVRILNCSTSKNRPLPALSASNNNGRLELNLPELLREFVREMPRKASC